MAQFTVNGQRFDPYKNFKFKVKWDGKYVAGISKVSALKRTTEVVKHREGGDPSSSRKSPGRTECGTSAPASAARRRLPTSGRTSSLSSITKPVNASSATRSSAAGFPSF